MIKGDCLKSKLGELRRERQVTLSFKVPVEVKQWVERENLSAKLIFLKACEELSGLQV